VEAGLVEGRYEVAAGTTWLFTRKEMEGLVEVLFVDEAGQVSLANVVSMGGAASSFVLLGDPNQLPQVSQGIHPDGAEKSALEHLIGSASTIAPDRGLFLPTTFRLHPLVNDYVSEVFYEGRLLPDEANDRQRLGWGGAGETGSVAAGIRYVPVVHDGNASRSRQEARAVAAEIGGLLGREWTDRNGMPHRITANDILVVAPYNAHVQAIRQTVFKVTGQTVRIGTVDKFQGQEAAVAIYSMATSSPADAPRDLDFLYSGNRLNVAVSRARSLAILVCSPELLAVSPRTPDQLRLANSLCRLVEVATEQAAGDESARYEADTSNSSGQVEQLLIGW
jgi:superfamily I DNA and/or RNA helicase